MKFIVASGALLQALNITGKCISGRGIMPILDSYLFHIRGNRLEVTGSNNEVFLTTAVDVESAIEQFKIAIPSVQLSGLIKSFPDQPLSFEIDQRTVNDAIAYSVIIKTTTGSYTIAAEDGNDYPSPKHSEKVKFKLFSNSFTSGVDKTLFAIGGDKLRPCFTGVNVDFQDGKATFTATNQHVLSTFSYTANVECKDSFIVPGKALAILQATPKNDEISISIDERTIIFELSEETTLCSVLISEKYVDYQGVIPINNPKHLVIDRLQLIGVLKRVIQLSNATTKQVRFTLSHGQCEISSEDTDLGQNAIESVVCNYNDDDIEIGLVGTQLIECLSKFDTTEVHIHLSMPNRAIIIRDHMAEPESRQNLMLTMPSMLTSRD